MPSFSRRTTAGSPTKHILGGLAAPPTANVARSSLARRIFGSCARWFLGAQLSAEPDDAVCVFLGRVAVRRRSHIQAALTPRSAIAKRPQPLELSKVAAASFVGGLLEWYDFYIFATASALVFGRLFF